MSESKRSYSNLRVLRIRTAPSRQNALLIFTIRYLRGKGKIRDWKMWKRRQIWLQGKLWLFTSGEDFKSFSQNHYETILVRETNIYEPAIVCAWFMGLLTEECDWQETKIKERTEGNHLKVDWYKGMSLKELSLRTAQIETYLDLMLKRDLWARKFAFSFCVHIIGKKEAQ